MVTQAASLARRALAAGALLLVTCTADGDAPASTPDAVPDLAHAQALFEQQRFGEVVQVLEDRLQSAPGDAAAYLLLGKAHGRLAEREPWYRAAVSARRCARALERAVELDPRDREALSALARFYDQAPAVLGGGADKAAALRRRLEALD